MEDKKNIVIGLEGPVGAGKTSIARKLLEYIPNSIILHGGDIYRAIVYSIMKNGVDFKDIITSMKNIDVAELMKKLKIEIKLENNETVMYLEGKKIDEKDLQAKQSSLAVSGVSNVADNSKLYEFGKNVIDKYREKYNVILASRDIVKMYPDVTYHFFIDASLEERLNRKCIQYKGEMSRQEIKNMIEERDKLQEKSGYYKIYAQTIKVDVTDCKTIEESTKKVLDLINKKDMEN
jgi:cytidylate kinase